MIKKRGLLLSLLFLIVVSSLVSAATIKGSIYNSNLDLEKDVLLEVDTSPAQKFLAKEGTYSFTLQPGDYTLTARNGFITTDEKINVNDDGEFIYDIFLLDGFLEEDEIWKSTNENLLSEVENETFDQGYEWWRYVLIFIILAYLSFRFYKMRIKYGKLKLFRLNVKKEHNKTLEEHKKEIASEPGYLERAVEVIKKHGGRIHQKQLRREMLDLSEAKVSLILTELEHSGKIEKIKKGRGNVIILKN